MAAQPCLTPRCFCAVLRDCLSWPCPPVSHCRGGSEGSRGCCGRKGPCLWTSQLGSQGHGHSRPRELSVDLQYLHPNRRDAHCHGTETAGCQVPLLRHSHATNATKGPVTRDFTQTTAQTASSTRNIASRRILQEAKKGYQLYVNLAMKGTST